MPKTRPEDTYKIYKQIREERLQPFKAEIDAYFKEQAKKYVKQDG